MNYFGMRLRYFRKQDDLTQSELGKAIGVAKSTISLYETGSREPDFETLEKIADYFNVSLSSFFLDEKTADQQDDGLDAQLIQLLSRLSDDQKKLLLAQIEVLLKNQ